MNNKELDKDIQNKEDLINDSVKEDLINDSVKNAYTEEQILVENMKLTDNVAEKIEELEKLKEANLRLMAEYDNYRKRTIKEKADLIKNGGEKVLIELLPVIDDFERALDTIKNAKEVDLIKEGIDLIYRKFLSFLQQNGIKSINSVGEIFESELFEAVATVPADNKNQKGKIIDKLQTGYTLNDKVIRHAKVVVAN